MTRIDPSRMQALISQNFDNAQASGQLGEHSVQIIDPPGPRVQPSASGFINKVKSLYDRDIRLQRAEEGVTRGVKSVDKALGKLLDAMIPGSEGKIDFTKARRYLEALPGSSHSATSRGADFNELLGARLKLQIGKMNAQQFDALYQSDQSFQSYLTQKSERLENSLLSGREQKIVHADLARLKMLDAVFSEAVHERLDPPNFNKGLDFVKKPSETFSIESETQSASTELKKRDSSLNISQAADKVTAFDSEKPSARNVEEGGEIFNAVLDMLGIPEDSESKNLASKFDKEGFSIDQRQNFLKRGGKAEDIAAFKKEGFSVGEMVLYAGFRVTEAKSLKAEYQRLAIPVNEKTIVRDFKASNLLEPMKELNSGAVNKVYKGIYQMADGSSFIGVFKAEQKELPPDKFPWSAAFSGISNSIMGGRNIASHALNDLLGFNVITRVEFGMNKDSKLGIVMEMAHGQSGKQTKPEMFDDPVVRRELTKLQWLDGLTGQVDRHAGNYFIETHADGRGKRVIGIDNDISFGQKITDPNHISKAKLGRYNGLEMPSVIDTEMAKAFMGLTPEKIGTSLSGLLDNNEIEAAKQRLVGIQKLIGGLEKSGLVIRPDQWGSQEVGALLSKDTSAKNATSYVARDKEIAKRAA